MRTIKGRVLFVGDDPDINKSILRILNRTGCQASACQQEKALQLIADNDFDCVILDWTDAYDRGTDFRKVISCLARQTPVFVFTGIASGHEVKLALSAIKEEKVVPLSLDRLVAEVLQEPSLKSHLKNRQGHTNDLNAE